MRDGQTSLTEETGGFRCGADLETLCRVCEILFFCIFVFFTSSGERFHSLRMQQRSQSVIPCLSFTDVFMVISLILLHLTPQWQRHAAVIYSTGEGNSATQSIELIFMLNICGGDKQTAREEELTHGVF